MTERKAPQSKRARMITVPTGRSGKSAMLDALNSTTTQLRTLNKTNKKNQASKEKAPLSKSEETFQMQLRAIKAPPWVREWRCVPDRKWRFDFAWPEIKLAVEIEGVIHFGTNADGSRKTSRHQNRAGYENDCDKYNRATLEGWRVLRFTQKHIKSGEAMQIMEGLFLNDGPPCAA